MCDRVTDTTEIMAGAFANVPYITDDSQTDDFESRATLLDFEILAVLGRGYVVRMQNYQGINYESVAGLARCCKYATARRKRCTP